MTLHGFAWSLYLIGGSPLLMFVGLLLGAIFIRRCPEPVLASTLVTSLKPDRGSHPGHQIVFYTFDVLHLDGTDLASQPLGRPSTTCPPPRPRYIPVSSLFFLTELNSLLVLDDQTR